MPAVATVIQIILCVVVVAIEVLNSPFLCRPMLKMDQGVGLVVASLRYCSRTVLVATSSSEGRALGPAGQEERLVSRGVDDPDP